MNIETTLGPVSTMALLDWTKNPRHVKFVEPHTTLFTF